MKLKKLKILLKQMKGRQINQRRLERSKVEFKSREFNLNDCLLEEVMIKIFSNLNNDDMWNAICAYERWSQIISSSQELINNFELRISKTLIERWRQIKSDTRTTEECFSQNFVSLQSWLSSVPVKNLKFEFCYFEIHDQDIFCDILNTFKDSVEKIEIEENIIFTHEMNSIVEILEMFPKLSHIVMTFMSDSSNSQYKIERLNLPNLKTLELNVESGGYIVKRFLNALENSKTIENVSVNGYDIYYLYNFFQSLPNLKSLSIPAGRINMKIAQFKLERFKITDGHDELTDLLKFLKTQKESLKFLDLAQYPYDDDDDYNELIEFIFDEMNLEELRVVDNLIISNHQIQTLDEVFFLTTKKIPIGLAFAERLKGIKELKFYFNERAANINIILILNRPTKSFENLDFLRFMYDQDENTGPEPYFLRLGGFFDNIRKIKSLRIILYVNNFDDISESLKSYLFTLTKLEELDIRIKCEIIEIPNYFIRNYCQLIKDSCKNLKILKVQKSDFEYVKNFFGETLILKEREEEENNDLSDYEENENNGISDNEDDDTDD